MFNRIKQFYLAITAKVLKEDWEFIQSHLNREEQKLFAQLQVSDQKHCVNVAYDIQAHVAEEDENREYLIRLGLLHDIGKTQTKLTAIDKSIIVILNKATKGKLKKHTRYKKINSYYYHGEIGSQILKELASYDQGFLERIKDHHNKKINDALLKTLQKWDDNN